MGYMSHHAIIVSSWKEGVKESPTLQPLAGIKEAHAKASELFKISGLGMVTEIVVSPVNGYFTFLVVPDGSKEGWAKSDQGDELRKEFILWMETQVYEDGSGPLDWALIQYGDGDWDNKMLADSDARRRSARVSSGDREETA